MSSKLVPFTYRSKDGTLTSDDCIVYIDPETVKILGVSTKSVFDPTGIGKAKFLTGLFLRYEDHEYGGIDVDEAQLRAQFIKYKKSPIFSDEFDDTYSDTLEQCADPILVYDETFNSVFA